MRKNLILVLLCTSLVASTVLTGCGSKNSTADNNTTVKEGVEEVGEGVKDTVEGTGNAIKDAAQDVKYTAVNFKDDIVNAGHDLKDAADAKYDKFTGEETDYYAGNSIVRVYEYDSKDALNADISKISPDGMTIDGEKAYDVKPYYYTNGYTLIVYEGNDAAYIDEFNSRYGNPVI